MTTQQRIAIMLEEADKATSDGRWNDAAVLYRDVLNAVDTPIDASALHVRALARQAYGLATALGLTALAEGTAFESMLNAKHAAELRIRWRFQQRYGQFLRCSECGAPHVLGIVGRASSWPAKDSRCGACGAAAIVASGYTPPPEAGKPLTPLLADLRANGPCDCGGTPPCPHRY